MLRIALSKAKPKPWRASAKASSVADPRGQAIGAVARFFCLHWIALSDMHSIVIMGVAGCGKSSLGQALAQALNLPLVEGDDFHLPTSVAKMKAGIPLEDADRTGWLDELGRQLQARPGGAVLTCSALRRSYRDRLRAASPGLYFAHLALTPAEALRRVAARAQHFFSPGLVESQFAALEPPEGEPGVIALDATQPLSTLTAQVVAQVATWQQEPRHV